MPCRCCEVVISLSMLVFFFKQKTAYEMRISDWSSDVCSSDLFTGQRRAHQAAPFAMGLGFLAVEAPRQVAVVVFGQGDGGGGEVGRASWRERVCKYG